MRKGDSDRAAGWGDRETAMEMHGEVRASWTYGWGESSSESGDDTGKRAASEGPPAAGSWEQRPEELDVERKGEGDRREEVGAQPRGSLGP